MVHDVVRGEVLFANDSIEDFVLLRSNGTPVFILANVVDDVEMHISHVIRAEEHLPNTPKQQMLWEALGHQPPVWGHVPVVVNEQRKKLSKRRDKVALEGYRDEGFLADAMVNYLMTLGWAPKGETEIVPWTSIERDFRLEDVTHSPAFFDIKKLTAFNGEYIRMLSRRRVRRGLRAVPARRRRAVAGRAVRSGGVRGDRARCCRPGSSTLGDVPAMVDFLFLADPPLEEAAVAKAMNGAGRDVLGAATSAFEHAAWDAASLKAALEDVGERLGVKKGKATDWPVRVAVTGRAVRAAAVRVAGAARARRGAPANEGAGRMTIDRADRRRPDARRRDRPRQAPPAMGAAHAVDGARRRVARARVVRVQPVAGALGRRQRPDVAPSTRSS